MTSLEMYKNLTHSKSNSKEPIVCMITNSYPPNLNGVSKAVSNLEKTLQAKGIKVYIITPQVPGVKYDKNVFPISSIASPKYISKDLRFSIYLNSKTIKFLKEKKVNLIHSHDSYHGGIDAILMAKAVGAKSLHTYHTFIEDYEYFKVPGYKFYIRNYSYYVCNAYDGVIALSSKVEKYLKKLNVTSPIISLPNVFVASDDQEIDAQYLNSFITDNDLANTFNIITFGRVAKEKSIIDSLKLLIPLFKKHKNLRYIIAGFGPQMEDINKFVTENALSDKVLFYGRYVYNDLAGLEKYLKFFLITSVTEVLPTTPLEACSLSLPVLAVNDICYNYIIKDGYNGYTQPLEQLEITCDNLINNTQLLAELKINAKQSYIDYTSVDYAQKYLDMYTRLVNK